MHKVKLVHPDIKKAMEIAEKEGYVVREMGEVRFSFCCCLGENSQRQPGCLVGDRFHSTFHYLPSLYLPLQTELVLKEYKNICVKGTWLDRLLCPIRGLLCHGVTNAEGGEREVRHWQAAEMKK